MPTLEQLEKVATIAFDFKNIKAGINQVGEALKSKMDELVTFSTSSELTAAQQQEVIDIIAAKKGQIINLANQY